MSSTVQVLLETLAPVFFVLLLGYYAGRRRRLGAGDTHALTVTLMNYALPCSLFLGVARTPPAVLRSQIPLLLVLATSMVAIYVLAYFVARRFFGSTPSKAAVQALTVSFANNVAVGLPLLQSFYGNVGLLAVAAGIVAGALIISPITLVLLECHASTDTELRPTVRQRLGPALLTAAKRPIILAPLLALLVPITGAHVPQVCIASMDLIGKATVGLALFLTGLILSAQRIRFQGEVLLGILFKNLLQPALVALMVIVFRIHGPIAAEAFLLAAVPAGFFGTVFGARYGVVSEEASSTLLLSTALSVATLPLAVELSKHFL